MATPAVKEIYVRSAMKRQAGPDPAKGKGTQGPKKKRARSREGGEKGGHREQYLVQENDGGFGGREDFTAKEHRGTGSREIGEKNSHHNRAVKRKKGNY